MHVKIDDSRLQSLPVSVYSSQISEVLADPNSFVLFRHFFLTTIFNWLIDPSQLWLNIKIELYMIKIRKYGLSTLINIYNSDA